MWNRDRRQSWFSVLVGTYHGSGLGGITSQPNRVLSVNSVSKPPPSYHRCSADCPTLLRIMPDTWYVEMWAWQPSLVHEIIMTFPLGKGHNPFYTDRLAVEQDNMTFLSISYQDVLYTINTPTSGVIMRKTWRWSHPGPRVQMATVDIYTRSMSLEATNKSMLDILPHHEAPLRFSFLLLV